MASHETAERVRARNNATATAPVTGAAPQIRIGISGWLYPPWRGVFYPAGLRQASELEFASRKFSSIEVNGSFYSLQRPETYQLWYEQTPPGFVFALKGGRFITHMKRLKDPLLGLANFFASGVLRLREKLGPVLWQLPPKLGFEPVRLRAFLELLPKTMAEAARLARRHDERLNGRSETRALFEGPLRHALEVRHPSFACAEYIELLREFNIASCVADAAGLYPVIADYTANFSYVRLHGAEQLYVSGYSDTALALWAERIKAWVSGQPSDLPLIARAPNKPNAGVRDVFVYFDNDAKVRAPFDAASLERLINQPPARLGTHRRR